MALQYSIQSELMPNYLPGTSAKVANSSSSFVFGATGTGGRPLIFAKTSPTQFCAFIPAETNPSCWEQIDLSSQLCKGDNIFINAACVKQKADGSLRMAIAFFSESAHLPSIFYAESLQPFTDPDAWKNIAGSFVSISFSDKSTITAIDMGEEKMPLSCIYVKRTQNNTTSGFIWACPIPGKSTDTSPYIIDMGLLANSFAAGRMMVKLSPGRTIPISGVYISWRVGNSQSFFTFESKYEGQFVRITFEDTVATTQLLASKMVESNNYPFGLTSLYTINGSQLQCWTPDMQTNKAAPTQSVILTGADSFYFASVAGSQNWPTHDLFIRTSNNDLLQGVATRDGIIGRPLKIDANIHRYIKPFAWRCPDTSQPPCCLHLITLYDDGNAPFVNPFMKIQDCTTGVWQTQAITLDGQTGYHEVTSFTTHIRIADENNNSEICH